MTILPHRDSATRRAAVAVRMVVLLAFGAFFVVPLAWVVLAPTKTDPELLTESPFAVGSFHNVWLAWEQLDGSAAISTGVGWRTRSSIRWAPPR